MIEVVFFDAGETLLHPHPSFEELFVSVTAEHGLDVDIATVPNMHDANRVMRVIERTGIRNSSLDRERSRLFWTELYRMLLDELGISDDTLVERLYTTFSSSASYKLFEDVMPCLETLRSEGYRLGLISNFDDWLEDMLVELEVGDLLEISVISGVVGVEKPDPEIYLTAIDRAGIEPGAAVHVGDSIVFDVEPAASVGIVPVLLDRAGRYPDQGCATIGSLTELPGILRGL